MKDSGVLTVEKKKGKTSIPENYGMISCPRCNGFGKVFRSSKEIEVCVACGGFGAIKMPEVEVIHTHGMIERWKNRILD